MDHPRLSTFPEIKNASALHGVSGKLFDTIKNLTRPIMLGEGERLFAQGDIADALYIVQSGIIEISVVSEAGQKFILCSLGAGSLFGETALFDEGPRSAAATAKIKNARSLTRQ